MFCGTGDSALSFSERRLRRANEHRHANPPHTFLIFVLRCSSNLCYRCRTASVFPTLWVGCSPPHSGRHVVVYHLGKLLYGRRAGRVAMTLLAAVMPYP
jgi:hypothetical protein